MRRKTTDDYHAQSRAEASGDAYHSIRMSTMGEGGAIVPTVSVGLPVFNGGPYFEDALRAVLAQTYSDLEVVVCDNASTDGTLDVCERYSGDNRLVIHKSSENIGATANFNLAFQLSTGPFFMWAASDDRFDHDFVRRCLHMLESDSGAAMCVSFVKLIDEAGRITEIFREPAEIAAPDLRTRARAYVDRREWYHIYGLMRRDVLAETALVRDGFGGDAAFIWEIVLRHRICLIEEPLLEYRQYRTRTLEDFYVKLLGKREVGPTWFSFARYWVLLWRVAGQAARSRSDAWVARQELIRALVRPSWRRLLFSDLSEGFFDLKHRPRKGPGLLVQSVLFLFGMLVLDPARFVSGIVLVGGSNVIRRRRGAAR